jgi:hypothetical protein
MPSVKIVHSLDHLWIHHFDSAFPPFDVYDWSSREAYHGSERLLPDEARSRHICHGAKLAQKSIGCDRKISHKLVSDACHVTSGKVYIG